MTDLSSHSLDTPVSTDREIRARPNLRVGDAYDVAARKFRYQREVSNAEFWRRLGSVAFEGRNVLEIGCGLGALSVDIALRGAAHVVAIDLDQYRIDFAREHLKNEYPALAERITFQNIDLESVDAQFDCVIAKDTFEHIENLDAMIAEIHRLLRPGGVLVTGFGPLYFSPFGDHGRFMKKMPWLPVFVPEPVLLRIANLRWHRKMGSVSDLGLNKLTPKQFRKLMDPARWETLSFFYNRRIGRLGKLFDLFRRAGFLERFFTVNIYAQFRKR